MLMLMLFFLSQTYVNPDFQLHMVYGEGLRALILERGSFLKISAFANRMLLFHAGEFILP